MPRLVFFLLLLLPLLACAQAALAARLPEVQAAGSLKAETPVQGIKIIPARKDSADAPPTSLAAAAPNAGAGQPPQPAATADNASPAATDAAPAPKAVEKADEKTAAAIISGSRRPGIIEHQIVRTNREDKPDINLSYPSVGIRAVDANIREWATGIADAFEETFNSPGLYPDGNRPECLAGRRQHPLVAGFAALDAERPEPGIALQHHRGERRDHRVVHPHQQTEKQ